MTQLVDEELKIDFDLDTFIECESIFGCCTQATWSLTTGCCGVQYGVYCNQHKTEMESDYSYNLQTGATLRCDLCYYGGMTDLKFLCWNLL